GGRNPARTHGLGSWATASSSDASVGRTCRTHGAHLKVVSRPLVDSDCAHDARHTGSMTCNLFGLVLAQTGDRGARQVNHFVVGIDVDLIWRELTMVRNRPCDVGGDSSIGRTSDDRRAPIVCPHSRGTQNERRACNGNIFPLSHCSLLLVMT